FGLPVATAGDVNGDGYADLLVGALLYDHGESDEGAAFLYLGGPAGPGASPDWMGECNVATSYYGSSLGTAGDVNGDGYDDVIVGAPQYTDGQTFKGAAFVYLGGAGGLATLPVWVAQCDQAVAHLGAAVAGTGDVNGDGYADVVVGAPLYDDGQSNEGKAWLYLGGPLGPATSPAWTAQGDQAGAQLGASVATAGDVNADGYADLVLGIPDWDLALTDEGGATVYLGGPAGPGINPDWWKNGGQGGALYGYSVATAGDVDGDGYSDLLVGAYQYDSGQLNEGAAFVYAGGGSIPGPSPGWTAHGSQAAEVLGHSLASAGDVNGDGFSDLIVGSPYFDDGPQNVGRARLYLGSAAGPSTTPDWEVEGEGLYASFGDCVAAAGDVNGDGYGDVIVGADLYTDGETNEGAAFVFLGSAAGLGASPAWTAEGNQPSSGFAYSVAGAGDVNGDGYGDVIVGAPDYSDGESAEGAAFVYLGSPAGLSSTPAWSVESNRILGGLGLQVASAGDVNGDGFSDVLVVDFKFSGDQSYEGRVDLYLGSAAGLSTESSWHADGDENSAQLNRAASAGDVNGDGYSDVVVGVSGYDAGGIDRGRIKVYHGSAAGLSTQPDWTADGTQDHANFGSRVASAGDLNGDGYSDIVVGSSYFDGGGVDDGKAFVYLGSPFGLGYDPAWSAIGGQTGCHFGACAACAGDVDGDGFSDLLISAPELDSPDFAEGAAYLYYGNGGRGLDRRPRQARVDDAAPIGPRGLSDSGYLSRLKAQARSPQGRARVRLQAEIEPVGAPFDGAGLVTGPLADTGAPSGAGSAIRLSSVVGGLSPGSPYHWRLRILSDSPFFPHSRWLSPPDNAPLETHLRTRATTDVSEPDGGGIALLLEPPQPNPFSGSTRFGFALPRDAACRLAVYDVSGRRVALLADGVQTAGRHTLQWDGRDEHGATVPTGVYLLRFEAGDRRESRKVIRLR
ncbi:FG-GAP repeat protein, partial [bacterium]|nr:FG-GAP repeat protein [bacterium]